MIPENELYDDIPEDMRSYMAHIGTTITIKELTIHKFSSLAIYRMLFGRDCLPSVGEFWSKLLHILRNDKKSARSPSTEVFGRPEFMEFVDELTSFLSCEEFNLHYYGSYVTELPMGFIPWSSQGYVDHSGVHFDWAKGAFAWMVKIVQTIRASLIILRRMQLGNDWMFSLMDLENLIQQHRIVETLQTRFPRHNFAQVLSQEWSVIHCMANIFKAMYLMKINGRRNECLLLNCAEFLLMMGDRVTHGGQANPRSRIVKAIFHAIFGIKTAFKTN